jgi:hypothetical protein
MTLDSEVQAKVAQWRQEANARLQKQEAGLTNYTPYYNTHSSEFPLLTSYNNRYSKTMMVPSNTHSMDYDTAGDSGSDYNVSAKRYGGRRAASRARANTRECQLALTYNDNIGVDGTNYKDYKTHATEYPEEGLSDEVRREMMGALTDPVYRDAADRARNKDHQIRTGSGYIADEYKFMDKAYDRGTYQQAVYNDWDEARRSADPTAQRGRPNEVLYNADYVNAGQPNRLMNKGAMRDAFINDNKY